MSGKASSLSHTEIKASFQNNNPNANSVPNGNGSSRSFGNSSGSLYMDDDVSYDEHTIEDDAFTYEEVIEEDEEIQSTSVSSFERRRGRDPPTTAAHDIIDDYDEVTIEEDEYTEQVMLSPVKEEPSVFSDMDTITYHNSMSSFRFQAPLPFTAEEGNGDDTDPIRTRVPPSKTFSSSSASRRRLHSSSNSNGFGHGSSSSINGGAPTTTVTVVPSVLHELLERAEWSHLLLCMEQLKKEDPAVIRQELSALDPYRRSTPIHTAVWKAPLPLVKLMISIIPFSGREKILLQQDIDGNTPLHLACANLDIRHEWDDTTIKENGGKKNDDDDDDGEASFALSAAQNVSLDTSVIKTLTLGAPSAHTLTNREGDCPLALLLTSPAMRSADITSTSAILAAEAAAEDLVKSILKACPQLATIQNDNGMTLLHAAAAHGAHELVLATLLETTLEIKEEQERQQKSNQQQDSSDGKGKKNQQQQQQGEEGDKRIIHCSELEDKLGRLPLHYVAACMTGTSPPVIFTDKLIQANPKSIVHQCKTGNTPLHLLVSNITRKILDPSIRSSRNMARFVELLLLGTNVTGIGGNNGTSNGSGGDNNNNDDDDDDDDDESLCPLLLKNKESLTPLHCCALFNTPVNVARILMRSSSTLAEKAALITDPNDATPLHLVCGSSNLAEMLDLIVILGTKDAALQRDAKERTPMHMAAENPNCTKYVIKALAEVNGRAAKVEGNKGRMPLHVALRKKANESVVKALLRIYPKAVKAVFDGGNTLFHEVCQYKTPSTTVRGLLQIYPEGAQSENMFGNVPLHVATAYQCSLEVVKDLIEAFPEGCLVKNKNEDVPLHYAASYPSSAEAVKFLIDEAPLSLMAVNESGDTPLDRAKACNMPEDILDLMRRRAKEVSKEVLSTTSSTHDNSTSKSSSTPYDTATTTSGSRKSRKARRTNSDDLSLYMDGSINSLHTEDLDNLEKMEKRIRDDSSHGSVLSGISTNSATKSPKLRRSNSGGSKRNLKKDGESSEKRREKRRSRKDMMNDEDGALDDTDKRERRKSTSKSPRRANSEKDGTERRGGKRHSNASTTSTADETKTNKKKDSSKLDDTKRKDSSSKLDEVANKSKSKKRDSTKSTSSSTSEGGKKSSSKKKDLHVDHAGSDEVGRKTPKQKKKESVSAATNLADSNHQQHMSHSGSDDTLDRTAAAASAGSSSRRRSSSKSRGESPGRPKTPKNSREARRGSRRDSIGASNSNHTGNNNQNEEKTPGRYDKTPTSRNSGTSSSKKVDDLVTSGMLSPPVWSQDSFEEQKDP